MDKLKHLCTAGGNIKLGNCYENSMVVLQIIKNRITKWSSISTSEYIPKRLKSKDSNRYLSTNDHSNIIHNI